MYSSSSKVHETLQVTQASGIVLEEIFAAISQINERNLVIASAAEEQAQVAGEVDRAARNNLPFDDESGPFFAQCVDAPSH